jgi:hypothetical protein
LASPPAAAARPPLLSSRPCRRRPRGGWDRQTAGLDDIRASSHNRPNLGQAVHNAVGKERVGLMASAVKNWWECTLLARLSAYACRAASAIDWARARSSVRPSDTGYISSPARTLQRKRPASARVSRMTARAPIFGSTVSWALALIQKQPARIGRAALGSKWRRIEPSTKFRDNARSG